MAVVHLWKKEYDQALPFCREALRIKTELIGAECVGVMNSWSNIGLISYAMDALPSALSAYRKAVQISSSLFADDQETPALGRLTNNLACVNAEIGNTSLAQSEFEESLRVQEETSNGADLLSVSIAIFNIGVMSAKQQQYQAANSHVQACYSVRQCMPSVPFFFPLKIKLSHYSCLSYQIQEALLGEDNKVVQSTSFYLGLLSKLINSSSPQTSTQEVQRRWLLV